MTQKANLALDPDKIRHDVSSALGLIDSAYEELKENPQSKVADRYFLGGVERLREIIRQLDQLSQEGGHI